MEFIAKLIEFLVKVCSSLDKANFSAHFLNLVLLLDLIPALFLVLLHFFDFFDVVAELIYFTFESEAFVHGSLLSFRHLIIIKDPIHDPSDIISFFITLLRDVHPSIIHDF